MKKKPRKTVWNGVEFGARDYEKIISAIDLCVRAHLDSGLPQMAGSWIKTRQKIARAFVGFDEGKSEESRTAGARDYERD
jgi:hypothetical protein